MYQLLLDIEDHEKKALALPEQDRCMYCCFTRVTIKCVCVLGGLCGRQLTYYVCNYKDRYTRPNNVRRRLHATA